MAYKIVTVRHVLEALVELRQAPGLDADRQKVVDNLILVFGGIPQGQVLVQSDAIDSNVAVVTRIEPLPMLKTNCT